MIHFVFLINSSYLTAALVALKDSFEDSILLKLVINRATAIPLSVASKVGSPFFLSYLCNGIEISRFWIFLLRFLMF